MATTPVEAIFGDILDMDSGMGVTGLPRLVGKQAPRGGWQSVDVPPWVQRALLASTAKTPAGGSEGVESVCIFVNSKANLKSICFACWFLCRVFFLPLVARC